MVQATAPTGTRWTGLDAGLMRQDLITAVDGVPLVGEGEVWSVARPRLREYLASKAIGDTVQLTFTRNIAVLPNNPDLCAPSPEGETLARCEASVEIMRLPNSDFLVLFILPYVTGIVVFVVASFLLAYRRDTLEGAMGAIIGYGSAVFMGGLLDIGISSALVPVWGTVVATALAGTVVSFSLVFPSQLRVVWRYPFAIFAPLLMGLVVSVGVVWMNYAPSSPYDSNPGQLATGYTVAALLVNLLITYTVQRPRAVTLRLRRQVDIVLIGMTLTLVPGGLWLLNRFLLASTPFMIPFGFESIMPILLLPNVANTFAIMQYRRVDTDRVISQSLTYGILLAALLLSVFLLSLGGTLLALDLFNADNVVVIALILFVMVSFFTPVRNRLQDRIDAIYYRARRNYTAKVEAFSQTLAVSNDYRTISESFRQILDETIAPTSAFIFLKSSETGDYTAYSQQGRETDVRFAPNSVLVQQLKGDGGLIVLRHDEPIPSELMAEQARLRVLRAQVIAPLKGANELNGFLVVSAPKARAYYNFEEVRFLNNLANQLAIGTERAQVIASLEQRVRELDVLSQVGQAVNFTIEFDVLLELINAQTSRLVDAPCFYIALYDPANEQLYYAFFLEGDDREPSKENQRWNLDDGLMSEIVRTGRAVRVSNYVHEMEQRVAKLHYETDTLRAWMGVPLAAGRQMLGVLAVGRRVNSDPFTEEQFKIFSDIGALAATSIDKARLFTQTKIRERQLTVLNDISRRLVATESDVERLLEIIMTSAVEILNAGAGALLLRAEDDDSKLEFRVVIGGAEEQLMGTRIPADKGIAGEVVKTSKPRIVNDLSQSATTNQKVADYKTQSLLAVPLIAKNVVIGVLEVLNKTDGTPFTQEDSDLLTTFSGQAAVAIENARLFRMTDIQLAQKVRELEALERMDNDLNRTLDLRQVANITVRASMQILNAQAGALGIVDSNALKLDIVGIEGYREDEYPEGETDLSWSLERGIIARVVRTKQADLVTDISIDPNYNGRLTGAMSQITLPMFSGDELNAILILERNAPPRFSLSDWAFAQRIAEHASIAIANAQLYAALTQANKSKSEFMGFAAHELKNPLTSVIGFTDLLRSGAVGGLSEQQSSLINVIHSNASRMQTIIEDLRDSAKMDANEFRVSLAPMNIRHAVIETLRPFTHVLTEKNQQLETQLPDDLPLVMGDETRLIQVLTNLVSNANKYSPPNTRITIAAKVVPNYVDQQGRKRGAMLQVSVIDEGLGMSKEDQARLFRERYFRSTNKLALEQPGTGLGMMLTYGIMQNHNGEIWVESELGKGSKFHVAIPLAPQELQTRIGELSAD
jgi:signal transduction histidine kinase